MDLDNHKLIVFGSSSEIATEYINAQKDFENVYTISRTKTDLNKKTTFIETVDYKNINEVL